MRGSFLFLDQTKENKFGGEGKEKKKKRKKEKKGEKNKRVGKKIRAWERRRKGKERKKERAGHALFNSRCSDGRKSIGRELNLVDSTRATSWCQK